MTMDKPQEPVDFRMLGYELDGVIYDTEHDGFDEVCLNTVKRVRVALATAPPSTAAPVVPEGFVPVPVDAYLWLMGMGNDGFSEDRSGAFWWRSAFNERARLDMMAIYEASRAPKPDA
jgi:hypothetical protein